MSTLDLGNTREQRFLSDLVHDAADDVRDHPLPELYAILRAIERMWGGHFEKPPFVPPQLIYYLAAYARLAHDLPENREERLEGYAHEVRRILKGFMESVALAIKDGSFVTHEDGAACIDLFRIPQWFYEEVMRGAQLTDAPRHV